MATFQARYSSAQNAAVIAAQLDRRWNAVRTVEAAAAGTLPEPGRPDRCLPAFTMPAATARDKATTERRVRKTAEVAKHGAGAELAGIVGALVLAARKETDRIIRAQRNGAVDPDRIGKAARMAREIAQLVAQLDKTPRGEAPAAPPASNGATPAAGDDWLAGLAAAEGSDHEAGSARTRRARGKSPASTV